MEILVTGCERSGTKMLSKLLADKLGVTFKLENKHTIGAFKYMEELNRWKRYINDIPPLDYVGSYEKHSLNLEINIDFLRWVKGTFPNVKIYYIIRDGRDVVSSIINKTWGISQTKPNYNVDLEEACHQWNTVIDTTWSWAQEHCEIIKYEDICDVVSTPLNRDDRSVVTTMLGKNLIRTQYGKI